jgi:hypothetical protein
MRRDRSIGQYRPALLIVDELRQHDLLKTCWCTVDW